MYTPPEFEVTSHVALQSFMGEHPFATLISVVNGAPVISHLPFIFDATRGPNGSLYTHMARANPQWRSFVEAEPVTVIFTGPHSYITPNWYENKLSTVPTWNYAAVHAHGIPRVVGEPAEFERLLNASIVEFEAGFAQPWRQQLPPPVLEKLMKAIVGIEIPIARLEGKFKLSQNRSQQDRAYIIAQLRSRDTLDNEALAVLMEQYSGHG